MVHLSSLFIYLFIYLFFLTISWFTMRLHLFYSIQLLNPYVFSDLVPVGLFLFFFGLPSMLKQKKNNNGTIRRLKWKKEKYLWFPQKSVDFKIYIGRTKQTMPFNHFNDSVSISIQLVVCTACGTLRCSTTK